MESEGENTLVINDLLSFLSCKINTVPRKRLFCITKEFYPKEEIIQAFNTLTECIPASFCSHNPKKDLLLEIADIITKLPEDISPIFVCQNVNNVPQIKSKKAFSSLTFSGFNLTSQQQQELRGEHKNLQTQILSVSSVVQQLKDQMEILITKCDTYDREAKLQKSAALDKSVKIMKSPEKVQDMMEEITGALIDTTRIRALRCRPGDQSPDEPTSDPSPKKVKKGRIGKRKVEDEFVSVSSSSDLHSSLEDVEAGETEIKDCFIPLGRYDECSVTIKKEPGFELNGEDSCRLGRRPQRQKFSKFSEDFVVDFGNRSAKKTKK